MSRRYGVVIGRVVSVEDRQGEGRVQVSFPWMADEAQGYWAPVATMMSGGGRGSWFVPVPGDEVLVAFEQGDVNHPYILGYLWNGEHRPPTTDPKTRLIRSVNGHQIELRDPDVVSGDTGGITIRDALGNEIQLANNGITITSPVGIVLKAPSVIINGRPVAPAPALI
jgi:uncharacterized protein involved in type VI secretion and phage assembly